jgi:hypothetical protein
VSIVPLHAPPNGSIVAYSIRPTVERRVAAVQRRHGSSVE